MKKITKAIIIVLILLLILGGASFAYVYFATDILKTDRQIFGKYIAQEAEVFDIFKDDDLKAYNTKKAKHTIWKWWKILCNRNWRVSTRKSKRYGYNI